MSSPGPRRALPEFAQAHVERYLATDGEDGHIWQVFRHCCSRPPAESPESRCNYRCSTERTEIGCWSSLRKAGRQTILPGTRTWWPGRKVQIQRKEEKFAAHARTAGPDEHQRLWAIMAKIWPAYDSTRHGQNAGSRW